ncbi:MAG: hypothetical protein HZC28_18510 [Spirochaetes bacterium]|nr:hypothetical protein [Spirochaetota bacterium]
MFLKLIKSSNPKDICVPMIIKSFLAILFSASIFAQIPTIMRYQGFMYSNGTPYTGSADFIFQIYDAPAGGFLLWSSTNGITYDTLAVSNGIFTYILGSSNSLTNLFWTGNGTFLQIVYKMPAGTGNWTTNTSRIQFIAAPYAFAAERSLDSNPVGTILPYYGNANHLTNTYNNRYLICDGRSIGKSNSGASNSGDLYKDLYLLIYQINSNADYAAATNAWMNNRLVVLPDMRGRFLRGNDGSAGRDPNKTARSNETGTIIGDRIGSVQGDTFQGHWHELRKDETNVSGISPSGYGSTGFVNPGATHVFTGAIAKDMLPDTSIVSNKDPRNTNETRPKNISINYIIKY